MKAYAQTLPNDRLDSQQLASSMFTSRRASSLPWLAGFFYGRAGWFCIVDWFLRFELPENANKRDCVLTVSNTRMISEICRICKFFAGCLAQIQMRD